MTIKCVVFDFGGVIMNYESLHKVLKGSSDKLNIDQAILMDLFSPQSSAPICYKTVFEGKMAAEEFEKLIAEFAKEKYNLTLPSNFTPIQDWILGNPDMNECMVEAIIELRKKGYKTVLLTNNFYIDKEGKLPRVPIDSKLFDCIIESSVEKCMKPDGQIYHLTESRAQAAGSEIVFLDDQPENLDYPRDELAWNTIQVEREAPIHAIHQLEQLLGHTLTSVPN